MFCGGYTRVAWNGLINGSVTRDIATLRAYGRGRQSGDRYRPQIDVSIPKKNKAGLVQNESLVNISLEPSKLMLKYRGIFVGKMGDITMVPSVKCTDTRSAARRRKRYLRDRAATDPRMQAMMKITGLVPDDLSPGVVDMGSQEIDILQNLGGYSLAVEAVMKDAIEVSLNYASMGDILRLMHEDIFDIGMMDCHVYRDASGLQTVEYVDPESHICPISEYSDCRDRRYSMILKRMTISQLRQECPDMTEDEIFDIARRYAKIGNNSLLASGAMDFSRPGRAQFNRASGPTYDDFTIVIGKAYMVCGDTEAYLMGHKSMGGRIYKQVPVGAKLSPLDIERGRSIETKTIQRVYQWKWVVGSDKVFDYGVYDDVVRTGRQGSRRAMLPVLSWHLNEPSMVERSIAAIDKINIAIFKKDIMLSKLPPGPRMAFDLALAMDSFKLGDIEYNMLQMLEVFSGRGLFFHWSVNEMGLEGGSNRSPITPINLSIKEDYELFRMEIEANLKEIRNVTGLNEVVDGTANTNDLLIGVMKGMEAASNTTLKPVYGGVMDMYRRICQTIGNRYQRAIREGRMSLDDLVVEASAIPLTELADDLIMSDFGFDVKIVPTQEEIQAITQGLMLKLQAGDISDEGFLVVINMLAEKDIEKAQFYYAHFSQKARDQKHQQQIEIVQAQANAQADAGARIEQEKRQTNREANLAKAQMMVLRGRQDQAKRQDQFEKDIRAEVATRQMDLVPGAS